MDIKQVSELPVLDQSQYPELPDDGFEGKNYILFGSKWSNSECEGIAAMILTYVARRGKWEPVPWAELVSMLGGNPILSIGLAGNLSHFLHRVADSGDLELLQMGDEYFIVPTTTFVETIKVCGVRYYDVPKAKEERFEGEGGTVSNPRPDNFFLRVLRALLG